MAIVVEDGTGTNASANSYASVSELEGYATLRGISLPSTTAEKEVLLIKAMDYLDAQRDRWKGRKTSETQPLAWPRAEAYDIAFPGALFSSTSIPRELEQAQLALAVEAVTNDLLPTRLPSDTGSEASVKIEGAVEVAYNNPEGGNLRVPAFAKADTLLAVLYQNNGLALVRS